MSGKIKATLDETKFQIHENMQLVTKLRSFRYTNNGKEYSESDYGSEYGMDTGGGGGMTDEHGQQQMHHNGGRHRGGSPSEAGTYHSRYDGGGSTLNR